MNHPYPIGINPVPDLRAEEAYEAHQAFIQSRAQELRSPRDAHDTIQKIMDDDKLRVQMLFGLEDLLAGHSARLIRTLDSCVIELARRELEEEE